MSARIVRRRRQIAAKRRKKRKKKDDGPIPNVWDKLTRWIVPGSHHLLPTDRIAHLQSGSPPGWDLFICRPSFLLFLPLFAPVLFLVLLLRTEPKLSHHSKYI